MGRETAALLGVGLVFINLEFSDKLICTDLPAEMFEEGGPEVEEKEVDE